MGENQPSTNTSTELARERSREAADRTIMAWIRTSLSLISFGFGIGKFGSLVFPGVVTFNRNNKLEDSSVPFRNRN